VSTSSSVVSGAPDLAPYEAAVQRVLDSHEPYPALVVDRHWNVTAANHGSVRLFGAELVGTNLVRRDYGDARTMIVGPHFRVNGQVIRTVGMVMRFDAAGELTLDELRVELTYPADETARRFFNGG
jgi:hypothetical protein